MSRFIFLFIFNLFIFSVVSAEIVSKTDFSSLETIYSVSGDSGRNVISTKNWNYSDLSTGSFIKVDKDGNLLGADLTTSSGLNNTTSFLFGKSHISVGPNTRVTFSNGIIEVYKMRDKNTSFIYTDSFGSLSSRSVQVNLNNRQSFLFDTEVDKVSISNNFIYGKKFQILDQGIVFDYDGGSFNEVKGVGISSKEGMFSIPVGTLSFEGIKLEANSPLQIVLFSDKGDYSDIKNSHFIYSPSNKRALYSGSDGSTSFHFNPGNKIIDLSEGISVYPRGNVAFSLDGKARKIDLDNFEDSSEISFFVPEANSRIFSSLSKGFYKIKEKSVVDRYIRYNSFKTGGFNLPINENFYILAGVGDTSSKLFLSDPVHINSISDRVYMNFNRTDIIVSSNIKK